MRRLKIYSVLVSFPFSDFSGFKLRPALCLTDPTLPYEQLILVAISSQVQKKDKSDIVLDPSESWFSKSGLKKNSVVKPYKLLTADKSYVKRVIGTFPPEMMEKVFLSLYKILFGSSPIGTGDYTKEREELLKDETMETIMKRIKARREEQ